MRLLEETAGDGRNRPQAVRRRGICEGVEKRTLRYPERQKRVCQSPETDGSSRGRQVACKKYPMLARSLRSNVPAHDERWVGEILDRGGESSQQKRHPSMHSESSSDLLEPSRAFPLPSLPVKRLRPGPQLHTSEITRPPVHAP